jgi:hypothetical protein
MDRIGSEERGKIPPAATVAQAAAPLPVETELAGVREEDSPDHQTPNRGHQTKEHNVAILPRANT